MDLIELLRSNKCFICGDQCESNSCFHIECVAKRLYAIVNSGCMPCCLRTDHCDSRCIFEQHAGLRGLFDTYVKEHEAAINIALEQLEKTMY